MKKRKPIMAWASICKEHKPCILAYTCEDVKVLAEDRRDVCSEYRIVKLVEERKKGKP